MVKIQKLSNSQLVITIPKRLAELKGWDKGTDLVFREHSADSFIIAVRKDEEKQKHAKKTEDED